MSNRAGRWILGTLCLAFLSLTSCGQDYHYERQDSWLNPFTNQYVNDQAYLTPTSPGWKEIDAHIVVHPIDNDFEKQQVH